jgi:gamma-glutamylputrescine oxidase
MNFSHWELDFRLKNVDFLIIGGGIVGLSSAYFLKKKYPDKKVVVVERDFISAGASSRNAGFACFGSPSEIIDDASKLGWESAMKTVVFRQEGLQLLKSIIPFESMDGYENGGAEIFQSDDQLLMDSVKSQWSELESACFSYLDEMPFSWTTEHWNLRNIIGSIHIKGEGILHPVKMLGQWERLCRQEGVQLMYGLNIDSIRLEDVSVTIRGCQIQTGNLILCTNGLTSRLLPGLDVQPARNQVLVTNEILEQPWNMSFHQREGYVYFRSVGKRVLIGGARDKFKSTEWTDAMEVNKDIIDYLKNHLINLLGHDSFAIESQWSGIMGIGNGKGPIIEKIANNVFVAVRMGGMGVAIGTAVGKRLTDLVE